MIAAAGCAAFVGPLPDVLPESCALLRTGSREFVDLGRSDWFEAWRGVHGCMDAPEWISSGSHSASMSLGGATLVLGSGVRR